MIVYLLDYRQLGQNFWAFEILPSLDEGWKGYTSITLYQLNRPFVATNGPNKQAMIIEEKDL